MEHSFDLDAWLGDGIDAHSRAQRVEESDLDLVQACRIGQPGAWEQLIRRHAGLVYAVARRYGLGEDESADVLQSVCIELWEHLDSVRDASVLKRWLAVVAGRKAWQMRKSLHRGADQDDALRAAGLAVSAEDLALAHADAERLRSVLERIPSRDRELIWYLFFDPACPTYAQIAERLGVSVDTVGSLRTRCLKRLRWVLGEHVA